MANYGSIKTMKAAAIGTIMPWTGDLTEVPRGWLICNGGEVNASDFPLLTQVIKTTYGGTVPSSGTGSAFPNYTGTIILPNISQKALSDVDSSYFGAGAIRPNIDTSAALGAVGSYIGSGDTDNGVPGEFNNIYTDIMFSYTPENDFSGSITGSTYDPGFGSKTVYTSPRKLGRRHTPTHSHPTTVPSISRTSESRPGQGVSCSREISYRIQKARSDDLLDSPQVDIGYTGPNNAGDVGNSYGTGSPGIVLANIDAEVPPNNMIPNNVASSGLSNWIGSADAPEPPDPFGQPNNNPVHDRSFDPLESVPYATGGGNIRIQNRNYDNGDSNSGDVHIPYEVMFNHSGISFNKTSLTAGISDMINAHGHESFDILYDKASLRMPTTITANVRSDVVPQNIPRALNTRVLTQTPSVIVMYIIRAY